MEPKRSPIHVHIRDFQSIEDLEILIDGFTCITGPTNIGKSAIMRSISGALRNIPVVGLVRKGAKHCSVKLHSEGWGFLWEKGAKSVNRYWPLDSAGDLIKDAEGKPKVLDKIGQGQIDEIASMGFNSVKIGDEVIFPWYADQFNPVFLLNKSGPAVTDFFSEVAHLKVLQDAVILCARRRKWALDEAKVKGDEIIQLREKEKKIEDVDILIKLTEELEQQAESIHQYEQKIERGSKYLSDFNSIRDILLILNQNVRIPNDVSAPIIEKLKRMNYHWADLEESANQIRILRAISTVELLDSPTKEFLHYQKISKFTGLEKLIQLVSILDGIDSVKLSSPKIQIDRLKIMEQFNREIGKLQNSVSTLSHDIPIPNVNVEISKLASVQVLNKDITKLKIEQSQFTSQLENFEKQLLEVQKELDAIPSCDACGRPTLIEHSHENQISA
jgi:hypothetical protein